MKRVEVEMYEFSELDSGAQLAALREVDDCGFRAINDLRKKDLNRFSFYIPVVMADGRLQSRNKFYSYKYKDWFYYSGDIIREILENYLDKSMIRHAICSESEPMVLYVQYLISENKYVLTLDELIKNAFKRHDEYFKKLEEEEIKYAKKRANEYLYNKEGKIWIRK